MKQTLHVYILGPIDHWTGWSLAQDAVADVGFDASMEADYQRAFTKVDRDDFDAMFEAAKKLAEKGGWEGDIIQGPYVSGLPQPDFVGSHLLIGWKQSNNGTTFVASPVRLTYLEGDKWGAERISG